MKADKKIALFGAMLFISLSLNLFTAGVIVGDHMNEEFSASVAVEKQDRQLRESLPDPDKLVLERAMDTNREKITGLLGELRVIRGDIRKFSRADLLDEKALGAALEAQRQKELALVRLVHQTRKKATAEMSPEGGVILSKMSRLGFNPGQCR